MPKWFKAALRYVRGVIQTARRGFSFNSGVLVNEDSAMQVAAFYRGLNYISTQIAKLPWNVKDEKNNVVKDKISRLLNLAPNIEMSAYMWRITMIQNAIMHGNAYAEIERDLIGRVVGLWPIPSQDVEPYRTPEGKLLYRVIGGSTVYKGGDVYIDPKDMIHLKNHHTKDGIVGQGVVAYGSQTLGISLGANKMAGNIFGNGGIPSGVIEVEGTLDDDVHERMKQSWREQHGGNNSGGVAIFEQGAKYKPISITPDVLQFLESRKFSVIEIARFLGVPPTKLFDTESAKYANQENSNLEVVVDTLDAWARNLENEIDVKVLNNQFGGKYSELDLLAVFRGDMATRAEYFVKRMQTGSITPNEIRESEGMAPYEGGDRFYIAVNNYSPADRVDEIIDAQIKPKTPPAKGNTDPVSAAVVKFLERK